VISATHLDAISELPNARLVAVHDADPARAQAFAGRAGCAAEPSLDALLARDDIDVVSVCVPSGLHAQIGIRVARAGKHLVIEKPIDTSLAAADALIAAVSEAGVAMTVISQHRFDPGLTELRELIDAGAPPSGTAARATTTAAAGAAPGRWTAARCSTRACTTPTCCCG
jgi:predicted dehydrogenase